MRRLRRILLAALALSGLCRSSNEVQQSVVRGPQPEANRLRLRREVRKVLAETRRAQRRRRRGENTKIGGTQTSEYAAESRTFGFNQPDSVRFSASSPASAFSASPRATFRCGQTRAGSSL